jgi:hypothetical protein
MSTEEEGHMKTYWIICKDGDTYIPVQVNGRETKLQFLVLEKDNDKANWRRISSCLGYRTRLSKGDRRLFETKEAAIQGKLNDIIATQDGLKAKLAELDKDFWKLKAMLTENQA